MRNFAEGDISSIQPIEALEASCALEVERMFLRPDSGMDGEKPAAPREGADESDWPLADRDARKPERATTQALSDHPRRNSVHIGLASEHFFPTRCLRALWSTPVSAGALPPADAVR